MKILRKLCIYGISIRLVLRKLPLHAAMVPAEGILNKERLIPIFNAKPKYKSLSFL